MTSNLRPVSQAPLTRITPTGFRYSSARTCANTGMTGPASARPPASTIKSVLRHFSISVGCSRSSRTMVRTGSIPGALGPSPRQPQPPAPWASTRYTAVRGSRFNITAGAQHTMGSNLLSYEVSDGQARYAGGLPRARFRGPGNNLLPADQPIHFALDTND